VRRVGAIDNERELIMFRTIQRAAVGGSIKAVRLPLDTAASLFGNESAEVAIDRADAAVRDAAGLLLLDPELRVQARRHRAATAERAHAAEQRRASAARPTPQRKRSTKRSQATRRQGADVEHRRQEAVEAAEVHEQTTIASEARRDRLEAVDAKAPAVNRTRDALAARDEAQRVERAASEREPD
jgi:hypothetical protein